MINLKNNEKTDILLVRLNHILLKIGDNKMEISPRRINIAKEEIEARNLNVEILEVSGDELQADNKKEKENRKPRKSISNEQADNTSGNGNKL